MALVRSSISLVCESEQMHAANSTLEKPTSWGRVEAFSSSACCFMSSSSRLSIVRASSDCTAGCLERSKGRREGSRSSLRCERV